MYVPLMLRVDLFDANFRHFVFSPSPVNVVIQDIQPCIRGVKLAL